MELSSQQLGRIAGICLTAAGAIFVGVQVNHPAITLEDGHVMARVQVFQFLGVEIFPFDQFDRIGFARPLERDVACKRARTGKAVELHGCLLCR